MSCRAAGLSDPSGDAPRAPGMRAAGFRQLSSSPPLHFGQGSKKCHSKKKRTLGYRCYFRGLLSGKGGQLIRLKYGRERGRERERLKKKEKGGKLLLSSTHTHMRRPSRGESNSVKPFLCHTAAPSKKNQTGQDSVGRGSGRRGAAASLLSLSQSFPSLQDTREGEALRAVSHASIRSPAAGREPRGEQGEGAAIGDPPASAWGLSL